MKLKLKHWHALANNWYIGVNYLSGDGYIAEKTDKDDHFGDHFGVHIGDHHYLAKNTRAIFTYMMHIKMQKNKNYCFLVDFILLFLILQCLFLCPRF